MTTIDITQPDVTLLMDMDGVIRNASFSSNLAEGSDNDWVGRPWGDTVTGPGHEAIRRMIADAQARGVSAFGQIVQRLPSGREITVEYTTLMLGAKAGFIAVGKSQQAVTDLQTKLVAAQQTMERDFWKLREIETRYRLLFEASNEAVLLVRDTNLRIAEANVAAIRALGLASSGSEGVVGAELLPILAPESRPVFQRLLARTREHGKSPAITAQIGKDRQSWLIRASLVMSDPGPVYLLQLAPSGNPRPERHSLKDVVSIDRLIDRMPDGFVVADRDGIVLRCNTAFLDLVEASAAGSVIGQRLSRWLSRPGADWGVLLDTLTHHHAVRLFGTTVSGDLGTVRRVEVSSIGDVDGRPNTIALILRDVERRIEPPQDTDAREPLEVARPVHLVGAKPLKDIIDDAVTAIERACVSAALRKSVGNRRAAAEILGLSRQTLYTKISKYDLESEAANDLDGDG